MANITDRIRLNAKPQRNQSTTKSLIIGQPKTTVNPQMREIYRYVQNTLPLSSNKQDKGMLKPGSAVKNLLPELKEENIFNIGYWDLYKERNAAYCWKTVAKKITENTSALTITRAKAEDARKIGNGIFEATVDITNNENICGVMNVEINAALPSATISYIGGRRLMYVYGSATEVEYRYFSYEWQTDRPGAFEEAQMEIQVNLQANTSYVLQVVDSAVLHQQTTNNILKFGETELSFDSYLFFQTKEEGLYHIQISGLTGGYDIYEQAKNGNITYFRHFKTPAAKVFLFKSNSSWSVNKEGIIAGIYPTILQSFNSFIEPVAAMLSDEEIETKFATCPPTFTIVNNTLRINFPNADGDEWEWKDLWKFSYDQPEHPLIMDKLCLLVYRDYLIDSEHVWNDNSYIARYGLLRVVPKDDTCIQYRQFPCLELSSDYDPERNYISLEIPTTTSLEAEDEDFVCNNLNLAVLCLLGNNRAYANQKNYTTKEYTSVAFAWGIKNGSSYTRLSDYSVPLIIEKSIAAIENNEITVENSTFKYQNSDKYYNYPAVYLKRPE